MKKNFLLILSASTLLMVVFNTLLKNNSLKEARNKGNISSACTPVDLSGEIDKDERYAFFEGSNISIPRLAFDSKSQDVLGVAYEERWIEVDLSEQKLKAWEGDRLFLETPISTGLPWWPTPMGEFRIWIKLRATKMEGGTGKYYYYLPNVPYVMFIENDELWSIDSM